MKQGVSALLTRFRLDLVELVIISGCLKDKVGFYFIAWW